MTQPLYTDVQDTAELKLSSTYPCQTGNKASVWKPWVEYLLLCCHIDEKVCAALCERHNLNAHYKFMFTHKPFRPIGNKEFWGCGTR